MTRARCAYRYETDRYPDLGRGCCWRPAWKDTGRCVWHADEDGKPIRELVSRSPNPGDRLDGAVLRETALDETDWFAETVLVDADFGDATADRADFSGADLRNASLRDASLRQSDFGGTNLEDATLRDADLTATELTNARLHEADLSRSYISRGTAFGETVIYERELRDADSPATRRELFDAATWTYRTLQFQFRQNALLERTTEYFVREKDLRRRFAWQQGNLRTAIRAEGSRWVMGYGYSVRGILATSLLVILLCGLVYPFVGGVRETTGAAPVTYALDPSLNASIAEIATVFAKSLYFSVISFTTLGAGDVQPVAFVVQMLSSAEALLGFVLLALLISVLTRRQYWL